MSLAKFDEKGADLLVEPHQMARFIDRVILDEPGYLPSGHAGGAPPLQLLSRLHGLASGLLASIIVDVARSKPVPERVVRTGHAEAAV